MFVFLHNGEKGIGGVENLLFNLASYADRELNSQIKIIGAHGSYLHKRLTTEKINCIFIDSKADDLDRSVDKDDVVVLFCYADLDDRLRNSRAGIIVWNVLTKAITDWNSFNIDPARTGLIKLANRITRRLVRRSFHMNSIICMDGDTRDELNAFLGRSFDFPLIPIPIPTEYKTNKYLENARPANQVIKISYLGRGGDLWKVHPLEKVVKDLNRSGIPYRLDIYTDITTHFEKILGPHSSPNHINYHINIYGDSLRKILMADSDLHIGMGTAALEGAALGIPTILVDPASQTVADSYLYQWLSEKKEFSLGRFIDNQRGFTGHDIIEIIHSLQNDNKRSKVSQACFEHVMRNHTLESVYARLARLEPHSSCKEMFRLLLRSYRILKLYPIFSRLS